MDSKKLITIIDDEAKYLDTHLREHSKLNIFFTPSLGGASVDELRLRYGRWLAITAQYVSHTTPMLYAAAQALGEGDDEDRRWSELFQRYADEETDEEGGQGHDYWALEDLAAIGLRVEDLGLTPHTVVRSYGAYFVESAKKHPYGILGAKGVLEHLSIHNAEKFEAALLMTGIPNIENALQFVKSHGVLDIDHVREGDQNLQSISSEDKLQQVLYGAFVTSGSYRCFLEDL